MSRRKQQVHYHLDSSGITHLTSREIKAILRTADDLIATGGCGAPQVPASNTFSSVNLARLLISCQILSGSVI